MGDEETIGIVGLGLVGQALGARLRAADLRTLGYDRSAEAMAAFAQAGGEAANSLAELGARVRTVLLAVFDTQGVLEVVEGEGGLLCPVIPAKAGIQGSPEKDVIPAKAGIQEVSVHRIIDCSTGDPAQLEALNERLKQQGITFIESPLSGSSQQIAAGEATALVGAEDAAWQSAQPLLALLAAQCIHAGPPGMGAKAKLATNLVLGLNRAVFAEGLVFAESQGIAPQKFLELVLATPARSDAAAVKGPLMVSGDFAPRSRIRQHLKDVRLMLDTADRAGVQLPFSDTHAAVLQAAVADGHGDKDNAAIVLQLRAAKLTG
ncbi:NAD(P)-dependent oxidoreductase [Caenimonas sedimenti]|uniref:NAD(P)-dependent oxidoreductase n=1 Tax=Caenimonas sedimenti TaxID=2596921 RepID=A0A562ZRX9_9BURK|nr:NAD(P)-dependent oxidoreductase [Caenimonas sedimenti]TWO71121.1 NAD(P)-dependent oxidoreductase [Caenimonas sedimenti]